MTIAYLTSGLPVQDTETPEPSVLTAYLTSGLPADDLPHTGYHLYVSEGPLVSVDFTTPTAIVPVQATYDLVGFGFAISTRYTSVLRPVIDDLETPDISNHAEFVTDGAGEWTGLRPDPILGLIATVMSGGVIRLTWDHRIFDGATPTDFEVNYGTTPAATGTAVTETYTGPKRYTVDITLADEVTRYFSVVARTSGLDSDRVNTLGTKPDLTAPSAPSITTASTWQPLQ